MIPNQAEKPFEHSDKPVRLLDPKSDIVFKKIFGQHPDLIKSFLNGVLPLPEGRWIESVTYLTPEQSPRIPSMKNTMVDVKCIDQDGWIFIVEMQMTWSASFTKRLLFGTSKAFVQQINKGQSYDTLCPVYGLAIVNEVFEKGTEEWFHHYRLTNVKDMDKSLEGLELVFLELPKFRPQTFEHRKVGALWLRFLRETNGQLMPVPPEFQDNPDLAKAVELAQESAYTPEELEIYDTYLDAIRVANTIWADAHTAGKAQGKKEGEQIGIVKGREEARKEARKEKKQMARKMLHEGIEPQKVSEFTGLSPEEIQSLLS